VGAKGEGSLEFDKGVGLAGEAPLDAVYFSTQDESGVCEFCFYDGAPLYGCVDIAAPGWSPIRRGVFVRGGP